MEDCTNQLCKENFLKLNEIARNSNKKCMEYVQYIMSLTEKLEALEIELKHK